MVSRRRWRLFGSCLRCSRRGVRPSGARTARRLGIVAHYDLGRGKLYRRTDKRVQTRDHLTSATTMYRDMGMTGGDGDDKSLVIRPGSETGS